MEIRALQLSGRRRKPRKHFFFGPAVSFGIAFACHQTTTLS